MSLTKLRSLRGKIPSAPCCGPVATNNLNRGFLFQALSRRIKLASDGTSRFVVKKRRYVAAIDLIWTRPAFVFCFEAGFDMNIR